MPLADLLLRLGQAGTYQPLWSAEILEEVERNPPNLGVPKDRATARVDRMREYFPDAEVTGFEPVIANMTNHPKDRHVLAAAVHARATLIVTANLKDFARSELDPHNIKAIHPDDFLLDQLDIHPHRTARCLRQQIANLTNPPVSPEEFLVHLARTAPHFARTVDAHGLLT